MLTFNPRDLWRGEEVKDFNHRGHRGSQGKPASA